MSIDIAEQIRLSMKEILEVAKKIEELEKDKKLSISEFLEIEGYLKNAIARIDNLSQHKSYVDMIISNAAYMRLNYIHEKSDFKYFTDTLESLILKEYESNFFVADENSFEFKKKRKVWPINMMKIENKFYVVYADEDIQPDLNYEVIDVNDFLYFQDGDDDYYVSKKLLKVD